jgi:uncharacterized SAM-binding protein YcdF (DUF218 family)
LNLSIKKLSESRNSVGNKFNNPISKDTHLKIKSIPITFTVIPLLLICNIVIIEWIYFYKIITQNNPLQKADLILVFSGNPNRINKGIELALKGYAPNIVISSASVDEITYYKKKYGEPIDSINFIKEANARTTSENAIYSKRIIKQHNFKSIILITSWYHLPRANFLLKSSLFNSAVKTQLYSAETHSLTGKELLFNKSNRKTILSEMAQVWGSVFEMIVFNFVG